MRLESLELVESGMRHSVKVSGSGLSGRGGGEHTAPRTDCAVMMLAPRKSGGARDVPLSTYTALVLIMCGLASGLLNRLERDQNISRDSVAQHMPHSTAKNIRQLFEVLKAGCCSRSCKDGSAAEQQLALIRIQGAYWVGGPVLVLGAANVHHSIGERWLQSYHVLNYTSKVVGVGVGEQHVLDRVL